jgi:hypothetical protein
MEVEDDDEILQRLFFKKFGRALPEKKSDDVDLDMDLIDLTEEQDEMNATPTLAPVVIVKTESIEIADSDMPVVNPEVNPVEAVEFLTPKIKSQDKVACFSLRQAPSGEKSDINRMSSKQTSLLRVDIKSPSDDASQDGTSVKCSWRLNLEQFNDFIIAAALEESMLKINQLKMVKNRLKVKNLKQRRADIYDCIRKGEKTLMEKIQRSDQSNWKHIQCETRENVNTLTKIMDNLQMIGLEKTQGEVTQYLNFSNRLTKLMTKINHIIANQDVNISGKVEPLTEQSVLKEEFCESLNAQSSKSATLHEMQQVQDKDDKRRKDAADHTAKLSDFNVRMTKYKLTSAGASSMPVGLTPRPDPNRTQQGPYAQAGPQFIGQHFRQPPPMFPNPPPMPPNLPPFQQHQAAARYPKRLPLTVNYNGIPKLKIPIFDGELSEYQKFKLTFNTAYDNGRNLPKQHLVSLLQMSLQGKPLKLVSDLMQMGIDDQMYACMWQLLDDRFGDRNTEYEFTVGLFKDTLPIKNGSLTEVERIYEIFSIQHAYYLINGPASLTMETSTLFQCGKEKLSDEYFTKFVCFAEKYKLVPNFTALITFMQAEFLFAQKEEREQTSLSHKSDITFVKKLFENLNLNDDAMALPKCSYLRDHQNKFSNPDEDDCSFFTNTRTGQRFPTRGFQNRKPGRTFGKTVRIQLPSEESLGKRKGQFRPQPAASLFKEGHCSCCKHEHLIPECPQFKTLSFSQQSTNIRRDKLCYHCLEGPHFTRDCKKNEGKLCGLDGSKLYHHRVLHRKNNLKVCGLTG